MPDRPHLTCSHPGCDRMPTHVAHVPRPPDDKDYDVLYWCAEHAPKGARDYIQELVDQAQELDMGY